MLDRWLAQARSQSQCARCVQAVMVTIKSPRMCLKPKENFPKACEGTPRRQVDGFTLEGRWKGAGWGVGGGDFGLRDWRAGEASATERGWVGGVGGPKTNLLVREKKRRGPSRLEECLG
jgi:hypothetical protein